MTKNNGKYFQNGVVLTVSTIIKHMLVSVSESELAKMFYNFHKAVPLRVTLEEMVWPQSSTPIMVKNPMAYALTYCTIIN